MDTNVFILHSLNGDTLKFWGQDVKEYLKLKGISVVLPEFPIRADSSYVMFDEILSKYLKNGELNKNSVVIGHSIGNAYFLRFCREHNFIPKYYIAVAPGAVYDYPTTRTDYIVKVKAQAYLGEKDFEFGKTLKNVYLLYSDEDDGNKEKFTRFEKDFNAKSMYLKGYNHFDGYHRIYRIPELLELLDDLIDGKPKRKLIQCVQNDNKTVSVKETICAIKKAGFDGVFVQWYNKDWDFTQQQQVDYCRELGLKIEFAHLGYKGINDIWAENESGDLLVENYLKDLNAINQNNISMVVMHLTSKSVAPSPSKIGIERLQKIVNHAEKLDIKIAFENTKIFGYLEYVFDHIKNKNIGICYDSGHCHCHFKDNFSWEKFKDKILAVHLHDNDQSDDLHLLPGEGTIDWKILLENLIKANYKGPITLESCYRNHYLKQSLEDFYKDSYKLAKKIGEELN